MHPSRIQAVDHVYLDSRAALEADLRWFYSDVAFLEELPASGHDDVHLRFRSERIEIRIRFVDRPAVEPVACRVTIAIPSLDEAAILLDDRAIEYERLSGLTYTDRCLQTLDPTGHRVELRRAWPAGAI